MISVTHDHEGSSTKTSSPGSTTEKMAAAIAALTPGAVRTSSLPNFSPRGFEAASATASLSSEIPPIAV
jgi:hypothetical protein